MPSPPETNPPGDRDFLRNSKIGRKGERNERVTTATSSGRRWLRLRVILRNTGYHFIHLKAIFLSRWASIFSVEGPSVWGWSSTGEERRGEEQGGGRRWEASWDCGVARSKDSWRMIKKKKSNYFKHFDAVILKNFTLIYIWFYHTNLRLDLLVVWILHVKSAQFELDVSIRVRFTLSSAPVPAIGGLMGLQIGHNFLSTAYWSSTMKLWCTKLLTKTIGGKKQMQSVYISYFKYLWWW